MLDITTTSTSSTSTSRDQSLSLSPSSSGSHQLVIDQTFMNQINQQRHQQQQQQQQQQHQEKEHQLTNNYHLTHYQQHQHQQQQQKQQYHQQQNSLFTMKQSSSQQNTTMMKSNSNDDNNSNSNNNSSPLKSLVVQWSAVVVIAIAATVATTLLTSPDEYEYDSSSHDLSHYENSVNNNNNNNNNNRRMDYYDEHYAYEQHKPLFPLATIDYKGFLCATLGLMVAAGGGIGGGGILVPIYILVMGFTPKHAIPLSNITVFGGSLANTFLNSRKRHPLADRPLVDWDLILIMEPLTIAGALMGAFLNKILREEVLAVMLVLLLSFTAYNTLKKAMKMYRIESAQLVKESELTTMAALDEQQDEEESVEALLTSDTITSSGGGGGGDIEMFDDNDPNGGRHNQSYDQMKEHNTIETANNNNELTKLIEEEKKVPMGNISLLVVMFVVVLFINIMKGGGAFPSPIGIVCGSKSFWVANLIMIGWIVMISCVARSYLLNRYQIKENCGYNYVEGDIKWTPTATIKYPIICTLAGFFAGMFGVGGGIVKGPLMLAMNVHPQVSSATSACMILFTSFTATTSFVVFGLLIPDYAAICLVIGFVATFFGQIVLNYLISKYQRNSYIAFSIGSVVLLSAFLMTIQSLVSIAENAGAGGKSGGICGQDA